MTSSFSRGINHVSKFSSLAARRHGLAEQRPSVLLDHTFTYHVPRRIAGRCFGSQSPALLRATVSKRARPSTGSSTPDPVNGNPLLSLDDSHTATTITAGEAKQSAIELYLDSLQPPQRPQTRATSNPSSILTKIPTRAFHTSRVLQREDPNDENNIKETAQDSKSEQNPAPTPPPPPHEKSYQEQIYERLHLGQFHRPTKEELLAAATGFWSRMKIRFKWVTIRSMRPFNMDEIFGLFSWIVFGHVLWLIIGTTTFVSLAIFAINTVFAQETLAGWVGKYVTYSSGLKVVFESAVVPKWSDGVITFRNVFVSRRPGKDQKSSVKKGSPEAAAAAAADDEISPDDQNYTQFDINIGEVNVTLSFNKWWNSKGLLQNVEVKHVRGIVDRTHVFWTDEQLDPKSYRHEHNPGDFEIENFKIEDLLLTIHQPKQFRPFTVSIYNADLPRLRKQWLFYDFLCANNMTGEFDRSLFTIHQRQTHSYTGALLDGSEGVDTGAWKRQSRIRLDALNIDHLNRGVQGPFSWITEGNVDIIADIMIPNDSDESLPKLMSDFYDRMEATLTTKQHLHPQDPDADPAAPMDTAVANRFLIMDLRVHLNSVHASVPLFTRDLSYLNSALIRPIVAYINSRRTFIPINCRLIMPTSDFDGSWTVFDSGLMDNLSAEVYEAFARDVTDEQARMRRLKKVVGWGAQVVVQAIFLVSLSSTWRVWKD
jgi:mitochondrial distribution and morphology protein 31